MNNDSPLVPQGSIVEQKNKGRARVKIAVFFVLAVHGIGLMALLMQGCKHDEGTPAPDSKGTNAAVNPLPALDPVAGGPQTPDPNNLAGGPSPSPIVAPLPVTPTNPAPIVVEPTGTAQDYKVQQGDSFWTLSKKFKVSGKAIADANPNVNSAKLKIGDTLHIPAPTVKAPAPHPDAPAGPAIASNGDQTYSVVSNDNLTKIASKFSTTPKAIRTANNLKTDVLHVGQKLKIPVKAGTASATPAVTETASASPTAVVR
jgi:LysM repeat protein